MQGHKIGCPRLEHLLNFLLRYGYSLIIIRRFVRRHNMSVKSLHGRRGMTSFLLTTSMC